jgi:hypothetical protein
MAGRPPVYRTCPLCLRKFTARELQAHKCSRAEPQPKPGDKIKLKEPHYEPIDE